METLSIHCCSETAIRPEMSLWETDQLIYTDVAQSLSIVEEVTILIEGGELERIILGYLDDESEGHEAFFEDRNSLYWEIARASLSPEDVGVSAMNGNYTAEIFDEFDAAVKHTEISLAFDSEVFTVASHRDGELASHVIRKTNHEGDAGADNNPNFLLISNTYNSDSDIGNVDIDNHYELSNMHECNSDNGDISVCGVFETLNMREEDCAMDVCAISSESVLHLDEDIDSGMDCSLLSETSQCASFDWNDSAVDINGSFETSSPCHEGHSSSDSDVIDLGERSCSEILDTDDFKSENCFLHDNLEMPVLFSPRSDFAVTAVTDDDSSRQPY